MKLTKNLNTDDVAALIRDELVENFSQQTGGAVPSVVISDMKFGLVESRDETTGGIPDNAILAVASCPNGLKAEFTAPELKALVAKRVGVSAKNIRTIVAVTNHPGDRGNESAEQFKGFSAKLTL